MFVQLFIKGSEAPALLLKTHVSSQDAVLVKSLSISDLLLISRDTLTALQSFHALQLTHEPSLALLSELCVCRCCCCIQSDGVFAWCEADREDDGNCEVKARKMIKIHKKEQKQSAGICKNVTFNGC